MTVFWAPVIDDETYMTADLFNTYLEDVDDDRRSFSQRIDDLNSTTVKADNFATKDSAGIVRMWTTTDESGEVTLHISTEGQA